MDALCVIEVYSGEQEAPVIFSAVLTNRCRGCVILYGAASIPVSVAAAQDALDGPSMLEDTFSVRTGVKEPENVLFQMNIKDMCGLDYLHNGFVVGGYLLMIRLAVPKRI